MFRDGVHGNRDDLYIHGTYIEKTFYSVFIQSFADSSAVTTGCNETHKTLATWKWTHLCPAR